ncbi:uncharacterized protein LOC115209522 [Argonauta hians]
MRISKDNDICDEGKDIVLSLKNGKCTEIYDHFKEYILHSLESSNDTTLKYYGHFVVSVLRTSVTRMKENGPQPVLLDIVDLSYFYFKKLHKHIQLTDPCFISKIFHVVLACITKSVEYVDYVLKFSKFFYAELTDLKSTKQDVSVLNKSFLLKYALMLETQEKFTDFHLTLSIRHVALKLLTLNTENISLLVLELGRTFERYRRQNHGNSCEKINLESAEIWDNVLKCLLLSLHSEKIQDCVLTGVLELHIHHVRFICSFGTHYPNSQANLKSIQSFLHQHIKKDNNFFKGLTCLCDAILLLQQHDTKNFDINFLFHCIENSNSKLKAIITNSSMTSNQLNLINDTYAMFIDYFAHWVPFKAGNLEKNMLQAVVKLLELKVSALHKKLSPDQCESSSANRTGKYNMFILNTYIVYMEVLFNLLKMSNSDEWLTESEKVTRSYLADVTNLTGVPQKVLEKHINFIGRWLRKFCNFCYINNHNKAGVAFHQLSVHLIGIQETHGENVEKKYISAYEFLAELYKRCGDSENSLKSVISCLCLNTEAAMTAALKMWIRIKKEFKDSQLANITLKTYILENGIELDKSNINLDQLLEREWQIYQSSSVFKKTQRSLIISMTAELSTSAATTYQKCFYLYELAQLLWLNGKNDEKCGKDYLLEAMELMTPLLPSVCSNEKILFGQLNLLLYIFEHEELYKKLAEYENVELDNRFQLSLKVESDLMAKLEVFLAVFEELFDDEKTLDTLSSAQTIQILQNLLLCNSIYTLALKPLHSLRVLKVALQIVNSSTDVPVELHYKAITQLCSSLSSVGAVEEAWAMLHTILEPASTTDTSNNNNNDISKDDSQTMHSLFKMLTQVELLFKGKQYIKAAELNKRVTSHEIFETNKSQQACAVQAFSKCLLSKLKLVPAANKSCPDKSSDDDDDDESPLELAYESVKNYLTIMQSFKPNNLESNTCTPFADLGHNSARSFDTLEKWEFILNMLESLLHLSLIYCHIGNEREAKCFIKEGIKLSYILALPRWNATFQLQLARINLLSNKVENTAKAIQDTKDILLTQDNSVIRKTNEENNKNFIINSSSPHSINVCTPEMQKQENQLISKFRWSADTSDEETIMRKDNTYESTPLKVTGPADIMPHTCVAITLLHNEDHLAKCDCHCCSDVVLLNLFLKYLLTQAELEQLNGNEHCTENILAIVEDQCLTSYKHIQENIKGLLHGKLLKYFSDNVKNRPENSIGLNNCLFTLTRAYLLKSHLAENRSQFRLTYEYVKKGLLLFQENHFDFSNPEVLSLHSGYILCLSNIIQYMPNFSDIEEIISPDLNLNIMSMKLSKMSLDPETRLSESINRCVEDIKLLTIRDKSDHRNTETSVSKSSKKGVKIKSKTTVQNKDNKMKDSSNTQRLQQRADDKFKNCQKTEHCNSENNEGTITTTISEQLQNVPDNVDSKCDGGIKTIDMDSGVCVKVASGDKLKIDDNIPEVSSTQTKSLSRDTVPAESSKEIVSHVSSGSPPVDQLSLSENKSQHKEQIPPKGRSRRQPKTKVLIHVSQENKVQQKLEDSQCLEEVVSPVKLKTRNSCKPRSLRSKPTQILPMSQCDFTTWQDSESTAKVGSPCKKSDTILKSRPKRVMSDQSVNAKMDNKEKSNTKKISGLKCKILSKIMPLREVENEVKTTKNKAKSKVIPQVENLKSKDQFENSVYNFDEKGDHECCKITVVKKRGRPPKKPAGWQSRLTEASNIIAREHRRGEVADTLLDKVFSVSPEHISHSDNTSSSCLSKSFSLPDQLNTSLSSPDGRSLHCPFVNYYDNDDDDDASIVGSMSFGNLSVSSPEIVRAVDDGDSCSDSECNILRIKQKPIVNRVKLPRQTDTLCQSKKLNCEKFQKKILESAYNEISHFPPCSLHSHICKSLAVKFLAENPSLAAFYLNESYAVTLRHSLVLHLSKKIRRLLKERETREGLEKKADLCDVSTLVDKLGKAKLALSFGQKQDIIHSLTKSIHPDLTVCQVSVIQPPYDVPYLIVTRYQHNSTPAVMSIFGYGTTQGKMVSETFGHVQEGNQSSFNVLDKKQWWDTRYKLDKTMENVVNDMEKLWLNSWKGLLLGQLANKRDKDKLKILAENVQKNIQKECQKTPSVECIKVLIDSAELLSEDYFESAVIDLTGLAKQDNRLDTMKSLILRHCKNLNSSVSERHPVTLILDKEIQHLPWENLPILRKQTVTRIPSLYYLNIQKAYIHNKGSILTDGIDSTNTYYVLNPDTTLQNTEEMFKDWFESLSHWEGVVGKPPTTDQFISALTEKDVMIYCGHGSGRKYLHGDYLQNLNCHAAALLMGCSSGSMETDGVLDEHGMITNYYLAFCPMIVANLWDVTDKDIDRFLHAVLSSWMSDSDGNEKKSCETLTKAVVKARNACKLSYLIGCAPVVYGIAL